MGLGKLQALVYDILPPATAITDYAIGLKKNKKLSANEQLFIGAHMAVVSKRQLWLYQSVSVAVVVVVVAFKKNNNNPRCLSDHK